MKTTIVTTGIIVFIALLFSGCATIFGGSKYYAHIVVNDNINAKIFYKGEWKGTGSTVLKVKRNEANNFSFTVKEDNCPEKKFYFVSRSIRGGAFAGSILGLTGLINGIPIPFGAFIDLATGAVWKPNDNEKGISKEDYNNFAYHVTYETCAPPVPAVTPENAYPYMDVVYLKNGSIIKGIIVEQYPNVQIKIQTKDGNLFVFKMDEIEKITKE
jgi:hypothetical protein